MINGIWQHGVMGAVSAFISLWLFDHIWDAVTFCIAVEAVQIHMLGLKGREIDTTVDLFADAAGIWAGAAFYQLVF